MRMTRLPSSVYQRHWRSNSTHQGIEGSLVAEGVGTHRHEALQLDLQLGDLLLLLHIRRTKNRAPLVQAQQYIQQALPRMHLLRVLLRLLSVEELQALDVVLEPLQLQFARVLALGDRFFMVDDLQMQLPYTYACIHTDA